VSNYHVFPVDDLIEHATESDDCVCIPRVEAMTEGDGPTDWLYVHSSLDGRELKEQAS
jgi:hypothetical protein